MNTKTLPRRKVTLYFSGEMFGNYTRIECSAFDFEIDHFAQYETAVRAAFVPKGSRLARQKWFTSDPSLVVLEGWGHPDPAPMMGETEETVLGVTVSQSRFSSFDSRWKGEFRGMLAAHVEKTGALVIADFHDHNPNMPFVGPRIATPRERYAAELAAMPKHTHFDAAGDACACETGVHSGRSHAVA